MFAPVPPPTLWARLYKESDPNLPNYPAFQGVEVPWEVSAINGLLAAAFSGDWKVESNGLGLAVALGYVGNHGLYELQVSNRKLNKIGYVFAKVTPWATLPAPAKKKTHPNYEDKVTGALMRDALKTHGKEKCPKCGNTDLHFYRTVLRCSRCLTHVGGC